MSYFVDYCPVGRDTEKMRVPNVVYPIAQGTAMQFNYSTVILDYRY